MFAESWFAGSSSTAWRKTQICMAEKPPKNAIESTADDHRQTDEGL